MAILIRDDFTVGADIDIASYGPYAYNDGAANDLMVNAANDRVEGRNAGAGFATARRTDGPTGDQQALGLIVESGAGASYLQVRMATSAPLGNYYLVDVNTDNVNEVELWRDDNGAFTLVASADLGLTGKDVDRYARIKAIGGGATVSVECQIHNTAPVTFSDTSASRKTSGVPGIGSDLITGNHVDNFQVDNGASTRVYFPKNANTNLTTDFPAGPDTSEATRWRGVPTKNDVAVAIGSTINLAAAGNSQDWDRMYIFDPFPNWTIVHGTIKCQVMCQEFAPSDNVDRPLIDVRIVTNDGSTVRATLINGAWGIQAEYSSGSLRNKVFANGDVLTPYLAASGERLVITLGHMVASGGGTTPQAAAGWGGRSIDTDLGENETDTSGVPWAEFPQGIDFGQPMIPITYLQAIKQSAEW